MLKKIPEALYWLLVVILTTGCMIWIFHLGRVTGPGPYLPSEDSFDYRNHHCYPVYNK